MHIRIRHVLPAFLDAWDILFQVPKLLNIEEDRLREVDADEAIMRLIEEKKKEAKYRNVEDL